MLRCEDNIVSISLSINDCQDSELLFELTRPLCCCQKAMGIVLMLPTCSLSIFAHVNQLFY